MFSIKNARILSDDVNYVHLKGYCIIILMSLLQERVLLSSCSARLDCSFGDIPIDISNGFYSFFYVAQ